MENVFYKHCYKKATNHLTHWLCRLFILYKRFRGVCYDDRLNNLSVSESFLLDDKKIAKFIQNRLPEVNPSTKEELAIMDDFDDVFMNFIEFLQNCENYELNVTQIFALFYILCDSTKNTDIILSHIKYLSIEGQSKTKRSLWEGGKYDQETRRNYFNRCIIQFESITERAQAIDDRAISPKLRKAVWKKCKNKKCNICCDDITDKNFEAGHITSRALGGQTELNNLIAICFACNRGMGIRNAYEYQSDFYPEIYNEMTNVSV
jgi:hypothetical protein